MTCGREESDPGQVRGVRVTVSLSGIRGPGSQEGLHQGRRLRVAGLTVDVGESKRTLLPGGGGRRRGR